MATERTRGADLGIGRAAAALAGLPLWLRCLLALLLGAGAALAFTPWHLVILLPVAFGGLALLLNGAAGWRAAALLGWAFGSGMFLLGLHWVGHAFLVDAERQRWIMPLAVAALACGLALFVAAAAAFAQLAAPGWRRVLALAAAWGLAEWLRGHVLTGFPWLSLGFVWSGSDAMLQSGALFGVQGLGLLTVLISVTPALLLSGRRGLRVWTGAGLGLAALLCAGLWLFGAQRLQSADGHGDTGIGLRLVQGGIPQRDKWRRELRDVHLQRYIELSAGAGDVAMVIWPETATPLVLENDPARLARVARVAPPGGVLITGTPRRRMIAGAAGGEPVARYFNGIVVLSPDGRRLADYDKHHLLPFGEFLPARPLLARLGLDKLAAGPVDFSHGAGPALLEIPGLPPVRPLICYEILFVDAVQAPARAGWLLNLTNDAWFGPGPGPRQHFAIARARAVELGLPVVRAANTGISAIIDPFGRARAVLPLGVAGVADGKLPQALPPTVYARFGDLGFGALAVLLLILALGPSGRRGGETHGGGA